MLRSKAVVPQVVEVIGRAIVARRQPDLFAPGADTINETRRTT